MNHNAHRTLAAALAAFFCMTLPAMAQQGSSLLSGLNIPPKPVDTLSPVEMKMGEGMPKLDWAVLRVGSKATRKSRMEDGYLLLSDGTRLEGQVSLKGRWDPKLERWVFTEAEFREAKGRQSRKIPASEVQDFGLTFTIADYTNGGTKLSKDPARNFHPATVRLADGTEMHGLAALHSWIGAGIPGGGAPRLYFAKKENANIQEFKPARLSGFIQTREDGEFEYISYHNALMPVLVKGQKLALFQNPFSSSAATGFLAGLRGLGSDVAQDQARKAAAKGAAKQEMERRIKNGESLGDTISGGAVAAADSVQEVDNAFSGIDLRGTKKEFVIRNVKTGAEVIVNDHTVAENLAPLIAACPTTASMGKKQQKEFTDFKNLEKAVRTLDQCF